MKKILIFVFLMLVSVVLVLAAKPDVPKGLSNDKISLPEQAVKIAPGVYSLGKTVDKGKSVEGYAFVDFRVNGKKPTGCNNDGTCQGWEDNSCGDCGGGTGGSDTESCYGFIAKGAKWQEIEDYTVDSANNAGLNPTFVRSNVAFNIGKWEDAADGVINEGLSIEIFGNEVDGVVNHATIGDLTGKNEVIFGDIASQGAIGITYVWGIFNGRPSSRKIVEWNQVYDDTDFNWSNSNESDKMDFESISTHELGHSFGMDDLYADACSEMTMYGYGSVGETHTRSLEDGDINGISSLY